MKKKKKIMKLFQSLFDYGSHAATAQFFDPSWLLICFFFSTRFSFFFFSFFVFLSLTVLVASHCDSLLTTLKWLGQIFDVNTMNPSRLMITWLIPCSSLLITPQLEYHYTCIYIYIYATVKNVEDVLFKNVHIICGRELLARIH